MPANEGVKVDTYNHRLLTEQEQERRDKVHAKAIEEGLLQQHRQIGSEGEKSYRIPINLRYDLIPPMALARVAAIYEEGAQKYGESKYIEKPLPFSVIMNHLLNHLFLYWRGDRSEDHLGKVAWGVFSLMVLETLRPDMNDLSDYGVKVTDKEDSNNATG